MERIYNCWIRFGRNCIVWDKFLCYFFSCGQQLKITKFWKFWGENFRPTKYPRVKILDPRKTHERKLWNHEILTRKNLEPTKYLRENILKSRNIHEKNIQAHEKPTKAQWHDGTRPTMARDPRNLPYSAGCSLHSFHQVVWRSLWFCNFKIRSMKRIVKWKSPYKYYMTIGVPAQSGILAMKNRRGKSFFQIKKEAWTRGQRKK